MQQSACSLLIYRTYLETWKRGEKYASEKRVKLAKFDEKSAEAAVKGTKNYRVGLSFRGGGLGRSCSCPVGDFCKHMVAVAIAWDQSRGIVLPTKKEVEDLTIPPPLVSYADVNKAYTNPLAADLEVIRLASSEIGSWSRPHARLPNLPKFNPELETAVTLEELKKAFSEIRSWTRKSSYDPYFCAGEMVAAFCEVIRLIIKRSVKTATAVLAQILREAQKYHYELIFLIDDSDGLHVFNEAHLEKLFEEIKKRKFPNNSNVQKLLSEYENHREDY